MTSVGWTSRSVPTDGLWGTDLEVHPTSNPEIVLPPVLGNAGHERSARLRLAAKRYAFARRAACPTRARLAALGTSAAHAFGLRLNETPLAWRAARPQKRSVWVDRCAIARARRRASHYSARHASMVVRRADPPRSFALAFGPAVEVGCIVAASLPSGSLTIRASGGCDAQRPPSLARRDGGVGQQTRWELEKCEFVDQGARRVHRGCRGRPFTAPAA